MHGRSDAAGDVHPAVHDVSPDPSACIQHVLVSGRRRDIRHGCAQIDQAHCVSFRGILFYGRFMHLEIPAGELIHSADDRLCARVGFLLISEKVFIRSADPEEITAEAQVSLLAGQMVQFHKTDLDLFVSVISEFPVRSQRLLDMFCQFHGRIQHLLIADSLIVSSGRLHEMTGAVEFMAVHQALELPVRLLDGEISSQITVVLLRLCYEVHHTVRHLFQGFIRLFHEGVGDCLQPFVDIAVLEHPSIVVAFVDAGCDPEVLQRMALLVRYGRVVSLPFDIDIDLIIQDFPLIGDHLMPDNAAVAQPEGICDYGFSGFHFAPHTLYLHECRLFPAGISCGCLKAACLSFSMLPVIR